LTGKSAAETADIVATKMDAAAHARFAEMLIIDVK
jgi:hypothetical protein